MKLAALNETLALVVAEPEDLVNQTTSFDVVAATEDLLAIKTWEHVIDFIKNHMLNKQGCLMEVIAVNDDGSAATLDDKARFCAPTYSGSLPKGDLMHALNAPGNPEYLDELSIVDINDYTESYYLISISEILHLRDTLQGLVRLASCAKDSSLDLASHLIRYEFEVRKYGCLSLNGILETETGFIENGLLSPGLLRTDWWTRTTLLDARRETIRRIQGEEWSFFAVSTEATDDGSALIIYPSDDPNDSLSKSSGCPKFYFNADSVTEVDALSSVYGWLTSYMIECLTQAKCNGLMYSPRISLELVNIRFDQSSKRFADLRSESQQTEWWSAIIDNAIQRIFTDHYGICRKCKRPYFSRRSTKDTCSDSCRQPPKPRKKS